MSFTRLNHVKESFEKMKPVETSTFQDVLRHFMDVGRDLGSAVVCLNDP